MEKFIEYAPLILVIIIFFIQYKIFVTPQQLTELKSDLIEYISEHYVSEKTYRDNNINLENRIDRIDKNINDDRGFRFTGYDILFHGICPDCLKEK